jgi:hypothetical protein
MCSSCLIVIIKMYVYFVQIFMYYTYDGAYGLCIALQICSELPPILGSVHHPPSKSFVSFYDVRVVALFLVES